MMRKRPRGGGRVLWWTCLLTCVLLVLNGLLVAAVYGTISLLAPALFKQPKFAQAVMFVAPVALLFVEWWLMDRLAERRT